MSAEKVAVAVRSLVKQFGEHVVLDGISLQVRRGEVCAILGPSGGGKTMFLRCLNGLEDFQAGQIELTGVTLRPDLNKTELTSLVRHVRKKVGMVFQQFNLFPHRTALGNVIEAPLHVLGKPRAE